MDYKFAFIKVDSRNQPIINQEIRLKCVIITFLSS